MSLQFLSKMKRKREIKRLEGIKDAFMRDYALLCQKYEAHLIPLVVPTDNASFKLVMQLDIYKPLPDEV